MSSIDINTVLPIVTVDPTLPKQDEASSVTADHPPSGVGNHTGTFNHESHWYLQSRITLVPSITNHTGTFNHADQFSLLYTYFDKMKH